MYRLLNNLLPKELLAFLFYIQKFHNQKKITTRGTQTDDDDIFDFTSQSLAEIIEEQQLDIFLQQVKSNVADPALTNKPLRCFISYAWRSENFFAEQRALHRKIGRLAMLLESLGIVVIYDRNDIGSHRLSTWMQTQIDTADYILLIGTYDLKRKIIHSPDGNVAIEFKAILNKISDPRYSHTLIPLLFEGSRDQCFPADMPSIVRECINDTQFYRVLFSLAPVGVVPALLNLIPSEVQAIPLRQKYAELLKSFDTFLPEAKKIISRTASFSSLLISSQQATHSARNSANHITVASTEPMSYSRK